MSFLSIRSTLFGHSSSAEAPVNARQVRTQTESDEFDPCEAMDHLSLMPDTHVHHDVPEEELDRLSLEFHEP